MNWMETKNQAEENILLEANLLARFAYLSESAHMRFFVEPEISWFTTDITYPNYLFNMVLRANFVTPAEAHAFINGLLKLNLTDLNEDLPFPPDFTVNRMENPDQLREFVTVLARNSNIPPAIADK